MLKFKTHNTHRTLWRKLTSKLLLILFKCWKISRSNTIRNCGKVNVIEGFHHSICIHPIHCLVWCAHSTQSTDNSMFSNAKQIIYYLTEWWNAIHKFCDGIIQQFWKFNILIALEPNEKGFTSINLWWMCVFVHQFAFYFQWKHEFILLLVKVAWYKLSVEPTLIWVQN